MTNNIQSFCENPDIARYETLGVQKGKDSFFYGICEEIINNPSFAEKIPSNIRKEKKNLASKFLLLTDFPTIKALTINFASSQTSIFEFQEKISPENNFKNDMHNIMLELLSKYSILNNGIANQKFYEILSSVDQDYGNDKRYSISFNPNIDIKKYIGDESTSYTRYKKDWIKFYDTNFANLNKGGKTMNEYFIKKINDNLKTKLNIQNPNITKEKLCSVLATFDFLVLRSFAVALNRKKGKNFLDPNLDYETFLKSLHQESQDNLKNKGRILVNYIVKNNIFATFLQELQTKSVDDINQQLKSTEYELIARENGSNMSGIIIKKGLKPVILSPALEKSLLSETVFVSIERYDMLLISTHLNSKDRKKVNSIEGAPRNYKNYDDQWVNLDKYINESLSQNPKLVVILGGDLNHHPEKSTGIFPESKGVKTTMKKRTSLQAQPGKINILDTKTADHIMVRNGEIQNGEIVLVNDTDENIDPNNVLLPSSRYHISDHFAAQVIISF
jgi:hypothetical protein